MNMKKIFFMIIIAILLSLQFCGTKSYNADIIIKNGTIVTVDSNNTIIEKGALVILDNKIIDIGKTDALLQKYTAKQVIDAEGNIVMPGLVNTHTHLAMTIFRGVADDITLYKWLHDYIFPLETKFIDKEAVALGTKLAIAEMIHTGTTTFNDMYFFEDEVAKAAKTIGMRGVINESLIDYPTPGFKTPEEGFKIIEELLIKYNDDELIDVGVAVHSPYTCSPKLLIDAEVLAKKYNAPYHIHLAETKWEFDTIMYQYNLTPVQYLDSLGVLTDRTIAAHCVWLTEKDIQIMADRKVGVAHNPESNMKISSGVAPIPELLKAGAEVGVGTDGVASNNNLNLIEEMHTMALLHKLAKMDPTVINAIQILRAGTIGGAKVIQKENEIGSLEIGKLADIIIIDTKKTNTTPIYNVYSLIIYSVSGNDVKDVIINGKIVMRNKTLLTVDEKQLMRDVNNFSAKIKSEIKE